MRGFMRWLRALVGTEIAGIVFVFCVILFGMIFAFGTIETTPAEGEAVISTSRGTFSTVEITTSDGSTCVVVSKNGYREVSIAIDCDFRP